MYIIDFGLSRKFVGPDGEIKPPRPNAGFRGTARYASIYSHASKELSPRDDLWSVFYLLVEFMVGSLPWTKIRDRDKVGEMKNTYMGNTKLVDKLPGEFAEFQRYLMSLDYYSIPNYAHLSKLFRGLLEKTTGSPAFPPYDWEKSLIAAAAAAAAAAQPTTTTTTTVAAAAAAVSSASVPQSPKLRDRKKDTDADDAAGAKSSEVQWQLKCHTAKSQDAPVGSVYNPDASDASEEGDGSKKPKQARDSAAEDSGAVSGNGAAGTGDGSAAAAAAAASGGGGGGGAGDGGGSGGEKQKHSKKSKEDKESSCCCIIV